MGSSVNPAGFITPFSAWGVHNNLQFYIQQMLAKVQTATIVKVISCTNDGGVSPFGKVNVQILVNQINSGGAPTPHVEMYSLPYLRLQGGANAVILDPQPGDIGIALFASRDITNVVSTQAQANPGSFRMHDFSDGMYLGGLLNGTPSAYVQFSPEGINIVSPTAITLQAPLINLQGAVNQTQGIMTVETDLLAGPNEISSANHTHGGVTTGSGITGVPTA